MAVSTIKYSRTNPSDLIKTRTFSHSSLYIDANSYVTGEFNNANLEGYTCLGVLSATLWNAQGGSGVSNCQPYSVNFNSDTNTLFYGIRNNNNATAKQQISIVLLYRKND